MNYGKLANELSDEVRKLVERIKVAEAREDRLAKRAREIEETEETPETNELLDRVSDLVNWQIKRVSDLKWRMGNLLRASFLVEEVSDLRSNRARRNRKSSQAARQARKPV